MAKCKVSQIACSVEGCNKPLRSTNAQYCEMHYGRIRRNGNLDARPLAAPLERRDGYVIVRAKGHPMALGASRAYEHRVVFFDAHGPGPHACHVCGKAGMLDDQHVDHLNDVRNDNRMENLKPACPDCNQWRCRTREEAARKKPTTKVLTFNGVSLPQSVWASRIGISAAALTFRLANGWPLDRALTTPRGLTGPRVSSHHQLKTNAERAKRATATP